MSDVFGKRRSSKIVVAVPKGYKGPLPEIEPQPVDKRLTFLAPHEAAPATEWIRRSLTTFGKNVASILPGHFEAYARIDHERYASLDQATTGLLLPVLSEATQTPNECYFAVWEGFGGLNVPEQYAPNLELPHRNYFVFRGAIDLALASYSEVSFHHQSANLWWPADHAWCVASEIDFTWTYIGGSRAMIEELRSIEGLGATLTDANATWHHSQPGEP